MNWIELVAIGLAGWRLSALLAYEVGPLRIFTRLRAMVGITHTDSGEPESWPDTPPAMLLKCVWCLSPWVCAAMWGLWQWHPEPVLILAASTIAIALERWNHDG